MNRAHMTASAAKARPRLMLALMLAAMALHATASYAQTHYVYRFSFTPPAQVFSDGFPPTGADLNLLNYLSGTRGVTGFVSVTASYANIQEMATTSLYYAPPGRSVGYIYRISTDSTFYDVSTSVRRFFEQEQRLGISGPHRSLMRTIEGALPLESSQRLVATRGIAPGMIQWGTPVRLVRERDGVNRLSADAPRDNPHWIGYEDSRIANANPYPVTWPDAAQASSSESCTPSDDEGAAGGNCTGDVYAVATEAPGGIEQALHYYSPFDFADCSSSSSDRREKRSAGSAICSTLPVVNLSRLLRVAEIMLATP